MFNQVKQMKDLFFAFNLWKSFNKAENEHLYTSFYNQNVVKFGPF
jgi:hypothetical protein